MKLRDVITLVDYCKARGSSLSGIILGHTYKDKNMGKHSLDKDDLQQDFSPFLSRTSIVKKFLEHKIHRMSLVASFWQEILVGSGQYTRCFWT
ncbi:hypothetical protein Tco_1015010 [Tanacetum coccineum]